MSMIKVPEFIIYDAVQLGLKYIRENWENSGNKNDSYLRRVLSGTSFQRYDFITQAEKVFMAKADDTRFLDVDLMFNMQRDGAPTIYITMPAEGTQVGGNGMGSDESYEGKITIGTDTFPVFTRRYQSNYNIMITSDNNNEVLLIYHTLRAMMVSLIPHLHLAGLENINYGGQDLSIETNNVPRALFMRGISLSLQYECSAPNIFADPFFTSLTADGTPIPDGTVPEDPAP